VGEIDTRVRLTCSRCLSEFQTGLTTRFAITFVEAAALPDGDSDNAGEELCEEDLTCITFSGESIDLRPAVQEQIVMAFPLRALCRESCKGLCVKCGKDLNSGSCDCRHTIPDNRFAVLKGLKIPG